MNVALRSFIFSSFCCVAAPTVSAGSPDSIPTAGEMRSALVGSVSEHRSLLTDPLASAWENPALSLYRYGSSLTEVRAGGELSDEVRAGFFEAGTYMVSPRFGITGRVRYANSRRTSGQLFESSDADMVGPFLTYASGDGTMREEEYGFGGSYTARLGRWNVGISGDYDAGLYYRTVDPRPRNVTGRLRVNPAVSFLVTPGYALTAGFTFEKYKQSSSISFVSELGRNMVYHLTGLGTAYGRFDGQGLKSYYTGYSFGAQLGLLPVSEGGYVYGDFSRTGIENILSDLNKLPMGKTSTPLLRGEAGWRGRGWIAGVTGMWERRRATENIFGDAASGQYPQIGSLTMYSRTHREAGIKASYARPNLSALLEALWESGFEQRLSPMRSLSWERLTASVSIHGWLALRKGGYLGLTLRGVSHSPLTHSKSGIVIPDDDLRPVVENILETYRFRTTSRFGGSVRAEGLFPINRKFMLGASADYTHTADGLDRGEVAVEFLF